LFLLHCCGQGGGDSFQYFLYVYFIPHIFWLLTTEEKFLVPDWGYKVDSGIGLRSALA
jgi:hypothetical protein